ncbi:hypothetical protein [Paraburkholderia sp. RL17-337-BIB-A]
MTGTRTVREALIGQERPFVITSSMPFDGLLLLSNRPLQTLAFGQLH